MVRRLKNRFLPSVVPLAIFLCLLSATVWANTKVIIAEGSYTMGDGETPTVAEVRALHSAKRMAMEQAGTYLQSYTKTKNFQLTEDEIQTIAGALVEVEVLEKRRTVVGEGFHFYVKIKATVRAEKADELVARLRKKSDGLTIDMVEQYKQLQSNYDRIAGEIDKLKKQLADAKSPQEKERATTEIGKEESKFNIIAAGVAGIFLYEGKQYDEAYATLTKALGYYPDRPPNDLELLELKSEIYEIRSRVLYFLNRYEEAISDCTEALRLTPKNARGYLYRGALRLEILKNVSGSSNNLYKQAIDDLTKAIELDTAGEAAPEAYTIRGSVYRALDKYDEAIRDYSEAIRIRPDNHRAYGSRASLYFILGRYEIGLRDIDVAVRLAPQNAEYLIMRALIYNQLDQNDKAISDASAAIRLMPDKILLRKAYYVKGDANRALHRYDLAINDFTEAIHAPSEGKDYLALAYEGRGRTYFAIKQFEQALSDLTAAIRLDPQNGYAYFLRAGTYMGLRREQNVTSDLQRSCDLGFEEGCKFLRDQ